MIDTLMLINRCAGLHAVQVCPGDSNTAAVFLADLEAGILHAEGLPVHPTSVLSTKPLGDSTARSCVSASSLPNLGESFVTGTLVRCRCAVASASNLSAAAPPFFWPSGIRGATCELAVHKALP